MEKYILFAKAGLYCLLSDLSGLSDLSDVVWDVFIVGAAFIPPAYLNLNRHWVRIHGSSKPEEKFRGNFSSNPCGYIAI